VLVDGCRIVFLASTNVYLFRLLPTTHIYITVPHYMFCVMKHRRT